jgi:hypothetical protein
MRFSVGLSGRVNEHRGEMIQDKFELWDIVSRDGTDQQMICGFNIDKSLIDVVCIKPSDCEYMQADNWVIGEVETNIPSRYELVSKCLTPDILLKQIGRSDLFK